MIARKPKCLFVNPPIYDFTAYDFWLRPLGMMSVAGMLRGQADRVLFDFMDRQYHHADPVQTSKDSWGRGKFSEQRVEKPAIFNKVPRYYKRFGLPSDNFIQFLKKQGPYDFVFIQSVMTYWYPGIREVVETVRRESPAARIIVGGFYATACSEHARGLGVDCVVLDEDLTPVWDMMGIAAPSEVEPAGWDLYSSLDTGAIQLTEGCPYRCSYCYVSVANKRFTTRPFEAVVGDFEMLKRAGLRNLAFYDDALLYRPEAILFPFLDYVSRQGGGVNLHTPNAMHARLLTSEVARKLVAGGMKTFYLGYESASPEFQSQTGSKLVSHELADAVEALLSAGATRDSITAYEILGHPGSTVQGIEESMRFAHSLGIRVMLSDFSPIPGTADGELCRKYVDLDEPLMHNKTAFPFLFMGAEKVNYYKSLSKQLNQAAARVNSRTK